MSAADIQFRLGEHEPIRLKKLETVRAEVAAATTALDGKQPLDADLTAIAALATTSYGRALLALADAAALRALTRNGAKVRKTEDQVGVNFTAGHNVAWNSEAFDDGWHDNVTLNSRLTVPAGVTRVRIGATVRLANVTASAPITLTVLKGGATTVALTTTGTSATTPAASIATLDACTAGDYYEINVFVNDASADITAAMSCFWIEAC